SAVSLGETSAALQRWTSVGSEHVTSATAARLEPWRLVAAVFFLLVVSLLMSPLPAPMANSVVPLVFLLCVGFCTSMADWVGGVAAAITALICMDLIFFGETGRLDSFGSTTLTVVMLAFVLVATGSIVLIERMKYDRANARLEAASLRAANTALSAVEIAAAQRPPGDREAYLNVLSTILTAMARVNRASAGAIYLLDSSNSTLVRAAIYGGDDESDQDSAQVDQDIDLGYGLTGRVALERRPIIVQDTLVEEGVGDILETNPHIRSAVGVPLIDPGDRLVGVAWVGLYVPYRFAVTAVARMQALANRTIAFMEAARLADDQDELLDRVQDHYRRLQTVIQTIPEAVMVARPPRGIIVASNAAAQRMFGMRLEGSTESRRADRLSFVTDGASDMANPMLRAMTEGTIVTGVELTVRNPSGELIPVVASAAPVRAADGSIDAVVGIFQDVAPLKQAERLRDEFVSIVSHELRSPLTPIRGFAQVVSRDLVREGGHDQHVVWLNTLQEHVDRMTRLVDDLLDVSRLRAGRLKIVRANIDLVSICESVVESWNATATRHTISLVTGEKTIMADVDGDRIHQILDNLVGNAVKYANSGSIRVGIDRIDQQGDPRAIISVTDEGPGIASLDRDAVFTPFFRARNASESAVPGLGLGLYISSELAFEHGGSLTVHETPEGGSRFSFDIAL
ncbi:MAG TPA: ATP-binding protein, partial [Thermomicrobiales bacterium]|nr:ATP-binding protein [Thermomicrobiales bacterium]